MIFPRERMSVRVGLFVFLFAFFLRGGWGAVSWMRSIDSNHLEFPDEEQYWQIADSLRRGDGMRDELGFRATRMPLYPALLAPFTTLKNGVNAAKVFHWVIGACTPVLIMLVGSYLFGVRVGVIAGLLTAVDPFLVFFSSLLLTEGPFLVAVVGLYWIFIRVLNGRQGNKEFMGWIALGAAAALCIYIREASVGLMLLLAGFVFACRPGRRVVLGLAVATGVVVLALLPWAWRNHRVTGDWCWLTHRGGISLYDGVGPQADGTSNLGEVKQGSAVEGLNEVQWDQYFFQESKKAIQADPGRILRLAGVKLKRMWNPIPNIETYQSASIRAISAGWTIPTFAFTIVGSTLMTIRKRGWGLKMVVLLLLPAMYFSMLHSLFVGSVRYRLAAVPFMHLLAAFAIVELWRQVYGVKQSEEKAVHA